MIVGYAKLYGHGIKADAIFEITNEIFRLFLGMLQLIGCHELPDRKVHWEMPPDTFIRMTS